MMITFPDGFLWGASTAPHQIEGNNVSSDFWANEGRMPGMERSGDACDSYHRYGEDMQLLADNGYNAYRFGIEWARIEPVEGVFSNAELAHYRRMIDKAIELGLTPVVTLQHFTCPAWFAQKGGWLAESASADFNRYVEKACSILKDVPYVITMNEPNMLSMMAAMQRDMAKVMAAQAAGEGVEWQSPTVDGDAERPRPPLPTPDEEIGQRLVEIHRSARDVVRQNTDALVGWTVANRAYAARPGGEEKMKELQWTWEDLYLAGSEGDDFVGVQAYTSQWVNADGIEAVEPDPTNTLVGTEYRPDSLGMAVRHVAEFTGLPVLITENGIATADDNQRIAYVEAALQGLHAAMADGADVRGYLHWSLLDNYEWGHWAPTFGLIAIDRETFVRTPKPSLAWLGAVAARNGL